MEILFWIFFVLVLSFSFMLFSGAPYLPTHKRYAEIALDLLNLKAGETLYELGSGDGRVLKLAARRGLNVVGYELNPILVIISRIVTWKYRRQVRIVYGNMWKADIKKADGVFIFLLDRYMKRFDEMIRREKSPGNLNVASYAFKIPNKKPAKSISGMFLYKYK
jgi:hypothetical protein